MKKKLFAALCAAMLSLCVLGTTAASAAEMTYQKGDFTMDGKVDTDDVTTLLQYFTLTSVVGYTIEISQEQRQLGDVFLEDHELGTTDCAVILRYTTLRDTGLETTIEEVAEEFRK